MAEATLKDYAKFSTNVYDIRNDHPLLINETGWRGHSQSSNSVSGFAAATYVNGIGTDARYVVSFRGTDADFWDILDPLSNNDWTQNITTYMFQNFHTQVNDAISYVEALANSGVSLSQITFTGHSLGGGLATLMAAMYNRQATVFDPAPTGPTTLFGYVFADYFDDLARLTLPAHAPVPGIMTPEQRAAYYLDKAHLNTVQYVTNGEILDAIIDDDAMPGARNYIHLGDVPTFSNVSLHSMSLLSLALIRNESGKEFETLMGNMPTLLSSIINAEYVGIPDSAGAVSIDIFYRHLANNNVLYDAFYAAFTKLPRLGFYDTAGRPANGDEALAQTLIDIGLSEVKRIAIGLPTSPPPPVFGADVNTVSINTALLATDLLDALRLHTRGEINPRGIGVLPDRGIPASAVFQNYHFALDTAGSNHTGGTGRDLFVGGLQADTFRGGAGDDILLGGGSGPGSGVNRLYGDAGKDILIAEAGKTELTGGADQDLFGVTNNTTIMDLAVNEQVKWSGKTLVGAKANENGQFIDAEGYTYSFASDSKVTVTKGGQTVTVNEAAGGPAATGDELFRVGSLAGWKDPEEPDAKYIHDKAQSLLKTASKNQISPLVLDLDGDGIELKSVGNSWARFDIDNDGSTEVTGWVSADDALLAWDRNGNGRIDNSTELFGSATQDGFTILRQLDSNSDGLITSADTSFGNLRLWQDFDEDGATDSGELTTLASRGITSIRLDYTGVNIPSQGNTIKQTSTFTMNGESRTIVDAWFSYDDFLTRYAGTITPNATVLALPNLTGYGDLPDLRIAMMQNTALVAEVQSLLARPITDWTGMRQDMAEVLQRWAGVTAPSWSAATGRPLDADMAIFLRKYFALGSANLPVTAMFPTIEDAQQAWTLVAEMQLGRILAPKIASLLPGLSVNLYNGPLSGAVNFSALSAAAPADIASAQAYWANIKNALSMYAFASQQSADAWTDELTGAITSTGKTMAQLGFTFAPVMASITTTTAYTSGAGNDVLSGNALNNVINGGAGDDTITGGDGADTLSGGIGWDTLRGGIGNDTLYGDDGNDIVYGEDGDDAIQGGNGDDTIYGALGIDTIYGNNGDDLIDGGDGNDTANGGVGQDDVRGGTGNDSLGGGAGNDRIDGGDGDDALYGEDGADTLIGGAGADVLNGNQGRDILEGGAGNDMLYGGPNSDTYILSPGQDIIRDDPESGFDGDEDLLQIWTGVSASQLLLVRTGNNLVIKHPNGIDQVTILDQFSGKSGNVYRVEYLKFSDGSQLSLTQLPYSYLGSSASDDLTGVYSYNGRGYDGSIDETFYGYAGNDLINAGEGNDLIFGGTGTDTIDGGLGRDMVGFADQSGRVFANLTSSSVTISGVTISAGSVSLRSLANNNTVLDQDILTGIEGIGGSSGNDILIGNFDGYMRGNAGNDYIDAGGADYGDATSGVRVNLQASTQIINGISVTGRSASDGLGGTDTFGTSVLNVIGSDFSDYIIGNNSWHSFAGGIGNDYLSPSGTVGTVSIRDSVMSGDAGNDQLIGGVYNPDYPYVSDKITYLYSPNEVRANLDTTAHILGGLTVAGLTVQDGWGYIDTLYDIEHIDGTYYSNTHVAGNLRNNFISTFGGNDTVYGYSGNDSIRSGTGSDFIDAGSGDDTIELASGDVRLLYGEVLGINDVIYAGDGNDRIIAPGGYIDGGNGVDTWVWQGGSSVFLNLGASSVTYQSLTLAPNVLLDTSGNNYGTVRNVEIFSLSNYEDFFRGSEQSDTVTSGSGGNDILWGEGGDDTLDGGGNDDIVLGGTGNDLLLGGSGSDMLDGGAGTDTVSYKSAYSSIRINLNSVVKVLGGISVAPGTVQNGNGTDTLKAIEIVIGSDQRSASDYIYGSTSNDTIRGLAGNDVINGDSGDDIISGGLGSDILDGGTGTDTLDLDSYAGVLVNLSTSSQTLAGIVIAAGTSLDDPSSSTRDAGQVDTISNFENIKGTAFNDWIHGSALANLINAGEGNDYINGDAGADVLNGEAGDDWIVGGAGNDIINGGAGLDTLDFTGYASNVLVNLGSVAQTLNGVTVAANQARDGTGSADSLISIEKIFGSSFADWMLGSANNDTFIGGAGNDNMNGSTGSDRADYSASTAGILVNLSAAGQTLNSIAVAANTVRDGLSGTDTLSSIEIIDGSNYSDWMFGSMNSDTLNGGAGNDILKGEAGNDIMNGGSGNDNLDGGSGTDTLNTSDMTIALVNMSSASRSMNGLTVAAGTAVNTYYAEIYDPETDGFDYQYRTIDIDTISNFEHVSGAVEALWVFGNSGSNRLTGSEGEDNLNGDAGDDIFIGGRGYDTMTGGAGIDTLDYSSSTAAILVNMSATSQTLNGMVVGTGKAFDGFGNHDFFFTMENVIGSANNDFIFGNNVANVLEGGLGNDWLRGDAGADQFIWRNGHGRDIIADYQDGTDKLKLLGTGASYGSLGFADTSAGATVSLGGNIIFTLTGTSKAALDASDFLFS